MLDTVFRARRAVTAVGEVERAIGVKDGTIVAIEPVDAPLDAAREVELGEDVVLLPGLVDTHVHVNEPGRTEWEGFETATRAAAAGGVTTIVDMPLNSVPPTTTLAGLEAKLRALEDRAYVGRAATGVLDEPATAQALASTVLRGLECGAFGEREAFAATGLDRAALGRLARREA